MSIELKDVTYIYMPKTPYERVALNKVNLTIEEGSFTAIAGHTGSGKSTLVGIFAAWWWNRTMAIVTQLFMNRFRKEMFNHLQDLPIKYFDTHKKGEIMSLFFSLHTFQSAGTSPIQSIPEGTS